MEQGTLPRDSGLAFSGLAWGLGLQGLRVADSGFQG